jgi:hypothetical protein
MTKEEKIQKAKDIIADIFSLTLVREDGQTPIGYGNWELNKATDAMYEYIKTIEND